MAQQPGEPLYLLCVDNGKLSQKAPLTYMKVYRGVPKGDKKSYILLDVEDDYKQADPNFGYGMQRFLPIGDGFGKVIDDLYLNKVLEAV